MIESNSETTTSETGGDLRIGQYLIAMGRNQAGDMHIYIGKLIEWLPPHWIGLHFCDAKCFRLFFFCDDLMGLHNIYRKIYVGTTHNMQVSQLTARTFAGIHLHYITEE